MYCAYMPVWQPVNRPSDYGQVTALAMVSLSWNAQQGGSDRRQKVTGGCTSDLGQEPFVRIMISLSQISYNSKIGYTQLPVQK
jgi:hypothetical protein